MTLPLRQNCPTLLDPEKSHLETHVEQTYQCRFSADIERAKHPVHQPKIASSQQAMRPQYFITTRDGKTSPTKALSMRYLRKRCLDAMPYLPLLMLFK